MYVAMRNARVNDKFQDSLYLFLELVRAGVMHGHLWSGRAFSGGPSFGTGEDKFPTDCSNSVFLTDCGARAPPDAHLRNTPQTMKSLACCS